MIFTNLTLLVLAGLMLFETWSFVSISPGYASFAADDYDVDTTGWTRPRNLQGAASKLRITARYCSGGSSVAFRTQLLPSGFQWLMVCGVVSWSDSGPPVVRWHPFLLSMPLVWAGSAVLLSAHVWADGGGAAGAALFGSFALIAVPLRAVLWGIAQQQMARVVVPDLERLLAPVPREHR